MRHAASVYTSQSAAFAWRPLICPRTPRDAHSVNDAGVMSCKATNLVTWHAFQHFCS